MEDSRMSMRMPSLNGTNYPTWKVHAKAILMRENLWRIVDGTETAPAGAAEDSDKYMKFILRKEKAVATIVLSVEAKLLYLIGDPSDPIVVWNKLRDQFQKNTWANKLHLRSKLWSLKLKNGECVQSHIKILTEIFDQLAVINDPVPKEQKVLHLLGTLPDSFEIMRTALEANPDCPEWENVIERILHVEQKLIEKTGIDDDVDVKAFVAKSGKMTCFFCQEPGHIKRNCKQFKKFLKNKEDKEKSNLANDYLDNEESDEEESGLLTTALNTGKHLMTENSWVVDSGASSHMSNDKTLFMSIKKIEPVEVILGDTHSVYAVGTGNIELKVELENGKEKKITVHDVLFVPKLSYNLLSVSKMSERKKTTIFTGQSCKIQDKQKKIVATGKRVGNLYRLNTVIERNVKLGMAIQKESVYPKLNRYKNNYVPTQNGMIAVDQNHYRRIEYASISVVVSDQKKSSVTANVLKRNTSQERLVNYHVSGLCKEAHASYKG